MADPDRLIYARLYSVAFRRTASHEIDDWDGAVAELRAEAAGRTDLLSELAGVSIGLAENGLDILAPQYWLMSALCRAVGVDEPEVEKWIPVGMDRSDVARQVPNSGGGRAGYAGSSRPAGDLRPGASLAGSVR